LSVNNDLVVVVDDEDGAGVAIDRTLAVKVLLFVVVLLIDVLVFL
jgi:preprotein translocase subunit Sec61beta